ncbi:MAG: hypothetical protein CVU05_00400 [Bacteroidetes bacterium HGW-Bacteroidetes-21]|nr:MAG: hypothetical protein CVU05_00400 [Bacteroidetes bacterium HGW-Bacteroidetes-21]
MKNILLLIIFLGITSQIKSQTNECLKDFDFLVKKIKADYPGYQDKVTKESVEELNQLEQKIREQIRLYPDSCGKFLSFYTDWFKDNHLRIQRIWPSSGSNKSKTSNHIFFTGNVDTILSQTSDSLEGIWHSFGGDVAIAYNADSQEYSGISISYRGYEKNQLVFKLSNRLGNEFQLISYPYYNDFLPANGKASIHIQNKVLELHEDTRFVKKTNSTVSDNALLYSYIPEFPNGSNVYPVALSLDDSTFYLRIPSFMGDVADVLVKKHWDEIMSKPNLIIDIRNNGGGQDNYFQILTDLIYNTPYVSKGVEWYATENNIRMFEKALEDGEIRNGEEGIEWTKSLVKEMKKSKGKFVIHPLMGSDKTIKNDTIYKYPSRVGIIINEGNASSAEQFLIQAKMSTKTILFGNSNTAGVLDYSNAISENLPSNKFKLIFPMTRSRRLPEYPIDNIGISPDVMIPFPSNPQLYDRLDQWVYFVKNYLELMNN